MDTNSSIAIQGYSLFHPSSPLSVKLDVIPEFYLYFGPNMTLDDVAREYWTRRHGARIVPMEVTLSLCLCGVILNTLNIVVFNRKLLRNSISCLLMCFELANVVIFLSYFVQAIDYFATTGYIFTITWTVFLRIMPFMRHVFAAAASWFAAAVGFWRCIAVAYTLNANKWLTKSRAHKLVLLIFAISLLLGIPALFIADSYRETYKESPSSEARTIHVLIPNSSYYKHRLILVVIALIFNFILPGIVLVISTTYLIQSLYRASTLRKKLSKRLPNRRSENVPATNTSSDNKEKSVSIMMVSVLLVYLVTWLPYFAAAIVYFAYKDKHASGQMSWNPMTVIQYLLMDDTLPLFNNTCTFFIYYNMSENYRIEFWRMFSCSKEKSTSSQNSLRSRI